MAFKYLPYYLISLLSHMKSWEPRLCLVGGSSDSQPQGRKFELRFQQNSEFSSMVYCSAPSATAVCLWTSARYLTCVTSSTPVLRLQRSCDLVPLVSGGRELLDHECLKSSTTSWFYPSSKSSLFLKDQSQIRCECCQMALGHGSLLTVSYPEDKERKKTGWE